MSAWAQPYDYKKPCEKLPTLIPVKIKGKYGYVNKQDKIVIKPVFDDAAPFTTMKYKDSTCKTTSNRFALALMGKQWYRIDTLGRIVEKIDPDKIEAESFDFLPDVQPVFSIIEIDSLYGVVAIKEKKTVVAVDYNQVIAIDPTLILPYPFIVRKGDKYGLINATGQPITKIIYDDLDRQDLVFKGIPLFLAKKGKEWFYVDFCGKEYYR